MSSTGNTPENGEFAQNASAAPAELEGSSAALDSAMETSEAVVEPTDAPSDGATSPETPMTAATPEVADSQAAQTPTPAPTPDEPSRAQWTALDTRITGLESTIAGIATAVAGLATSVAEITRLGQRHADHVDELHSDNQRLRSGEISLAVAPLHRDLIRLHDEVQSLEDTAGEGAADLALVRARVTDVLGRWGIIRHVPEIGDPFDSKVHQGVGRIDSNDGPDGSVARVRRAGFAHEDGRSIRVAEVEVFRAVEVAPTPDVDLAPSEPEAAASSEVAEPETEASPDATPDQTPAVSEAFADGEPADPAQPVPTATDQKTDAPTAREP